MKKTFVEWLVICSIVLFLPAMVFARNVGDTFRLVYTCVNSSGDPVEGQSITVKIQKASTGDWFDFNDSTFKNASWTNKSATMTEDATEHQYSYVWTPPGSETSAEQYSFVVDNANTTYKDHRVKVVDYQNIGNSTFAGGAVASVTGGVGGNVTGSVGSVIGGVTVTTNNDKTGYSLTTAPPTAAEIQAELEENGASILDTLGDRLLGTIAAGTHNPQSGDAYAIVNNGTYGNSAIKGYVDDIESRLTAARAGYLDKLNVTGTLAHSDAAATYKADVSALALEATLDGIKGTTFNTSTDSLEALRDRGDSAWITATGFSTHSAADVLAAIQAEGTYLKNLYDNQGNWLTATGFATPGDAMTLTAAYDAAKTAAKAGDAMTLTAAYDAAKTALPAGSYTAPDNAGIAAIQAKTDNLPSDPADESDLETLIDALPNNTEFEAAFTEIKGATWSSLTDTLEAIRDRGDAAWLTAAGFAVPGDAMTLTEAYDAAKTASQAGDAMTLTGAYDAAKTAAQAGDTMKVSSGTGAGQVNLVSGAVALQADQAVNATKIEGLDATDQLDAHDGNPPAASDIKTALEADGSKLDHLWEMTEDDGGVRRYTANALEQAPTGGSAPTAVQIREEIDSNSTQLAAIVTSTGTTIPGLINDLNNLDLQDVRDAMKLAPSEGAAAADSIDDKLADAQADLDNPSQYKADVSTLETRLSADRAGYLDNLNVAGTLANTDNASSFKATGFSTHSASDVAALILATPANKIVTDASGRVTVGTNADKTGYTVSTVSDKTGYSLTQAFPTNFSSLAITDAGAVTAGTVSDKTGYSLTQAFPTNFSSMSVDGSGYVRLQATTHTGAIIPTVSTLTNAPGDSSGTTTLLSRLSATRAGYLDRLDAAMTSRAPASTALSNAIWTDAKAAFLDAKVSEAGGGLTVEDIVDGIDTEFGTQWDRIDKNTKMTR